MAAFELAIENRNDTGKGVARKLRATGKIPGICYSPGEDAKPIALDPRALDRLIRSSSAGMNTLIDLKGGDSLDGTVVLVKDIQRDPVKGNALHADLYAIDVNKAIHVSVPIQLDGEAKGVKLDGGILDQALREVELNCLPRAIPEEIRCDVSALELNDSLHVRDLILPDGVELLTDGDLSIVSVATPKEVEEATPDVEETAEAAAAEGAAAEGGEGGEGKAD